LYELFNTLAILTYPDGTAPVLQDDTEMPWAEFNDISKTMALGTILFDNPVFRQLSSDKVSAFKFWFVNKDQLNSLNSSDRVKPIFGSYAFDETGYYIMRDSTQDDGLYMIIDAGLEKDKPSHQHAGVLGVEAYAYGNVVLPNYQVRYVLPDFKYFKSSFVKNVALADTLAQGGKWRPNSGGSGYGQWTDLPVPEVVGWLTADHFDYFCGTHNFHDDQDINYHREVIFVKDGFWIIRDFFESDELHNYQQIWQGHYSVEKENYWIRSTFADGKGLDIVQLGDSEHDITTSGKRGKNNVLFNTGKNKNYTFTTVLYPFRGFSERIDENENLKDFELINWRFTKNSDQKSNLQDWCSDASYAVLKDQVWILLDATYFELKNQKIVFEKATDFIIIQTDSGIELNHLGYKSVIIQSNNLVNELKNQMELNPGYSTKIE
jgi:hypothetical protein